MEEEYEYEKLPVKFTDEYLKDIDSPSCRDVDYDDEIDSDKDSDKRYVEHFFQLNNRLKFAFRYYTKTKTISYIYIMDEEAENGWEKFYEFKILNKLISEFNVEKNTFNWDFDFKKYEI
jgi:hypothetical protein